MYKKELRYYFTTPIAYIVIGLYLLGISLFLWVIPGEWNIIESGYAQVDGLFQLSPWLMLLLCPALTMRLFAEERQSGTWDLLRTKHYPIWRIVVDKYLAAWTLMIMGLLPCMVHYYAVAYIAEPMGNLDGGAFLGSMLGLLLISAVFIAIGEMMSTLSKSQIVSFILGALACFILYWTVLQDHYRSLSRGVIDMRDCVLLVSFVVIALVITTILANRIHRK